MSSHPLMYDTEEQRYMLHLKNGPNAGTVFCVELTMCQSPLCECQDVTLSCSPLGENPVSTLPPLTFSLDLEERCVKHGDKQPLSPQALSLADSLMAEMREENWKDLYQRFYTYKESKTEEVDCVALDASFPPENMMDPTLMVAYKDILPFAKAFPFMLGADHWLVDEQYCMNPECDCRDVFFDFLRIDVPLEGKASVVQHMPTATYDIRRDTFKPLTPPWSERPVLEALTKALREAHPGLAAEVRKRRGALRTLYRKARRRAYREASPLVVPSPEVRPNEPCPCGSGKKYKKCCGRIA
jgi:hypothetical protein